MIVTFRNLFCEEVINQYKTCLNNWVFLAFFLSSQNFLIKLALQAYRCIFQMGLMVKNMCFFVRGDRFQSKEK